MNYYIGEFKIDNENKKTAGNKARDDIESICDNLGMSCIDIPSFESRRISNFLLGKIKEHIDVLNIWKEKISILKSNDSVLIQFPLIEHSIFFYKIVDMLNKNNVKSILLVHDLECMRYAKNHDEKISKKIRLNLEEIRCLKKCTFLICHNDKMKKMLMDKGIDSNKIIVLEIFDYLIPNLNRTVDNTDNVIIAGNLIESKSGYVYDLPNNQEFNLYGVNYKEQNKTNVHYQGSFLPDELPNKLSGKFGLVWDGPSSNTCEGVFGSYLRINNPHKTSLYLASEIPVIIWGEAALAPFIKKNNCGIVVSSLYEISDKLSNFSNNDYCEMLKNTKRIGNQLREGYYTIKALNQCK